MPRERDALAPPPPGAREKSARLFSRKAPKGAFAVEHPRRSATVTSAALRKVGTDSRAQRRRRRSQAQADREWQAEAFGYLTTVGELGYLVNLQANTVALCNFPVRRWDEESTSWKANEAGTEEHDDAPERVMEVFYGPYGGRTELIRRAAINLFTAGETHLLGTKRDDGGILWEFLSVMELWLEESGRYVRRPQGLTGNDSGLEFLDGGTSDTEGHETDYYVARLWRSSPEYSDLADSEVKRVLPILAEIVSLTQMVDAAIKSRIAAKMFFIPDELSFSGMDPDEPVDDADDNVEEDDPLIAELFDHMTAPVEDPTSAARLVPIILRGPGEYGQYIADFDLSRGPDDTARELREEALRRLARGLDSPPELLGGRANVNHWTSAIIDQDFVVKHIVPVGQLIADFITVAYLRPMLEAYEEMSPEEAANWRVEFDPSPVIARADEAQTARDLSEILSDVAVVEANGFTKADMADEDERFQRRVWHLVSSGMFPGLLNMLEGFESVDVREVSQAGMPPQLTQAADPLQSDEVTDDELVDATSGSETPDRPNELAVLIERLTTSADHELARARDRAGAKVLAAGQGSPDFKERMRAVSKDRVVGLTTSDELGKFGLNPSRLINGAFDQFNSQARVWIAAWAFESLGANYVTADTVGAVAADALTDALTEFASRTLTDDLRRLPSGLRVPTELAHQAIETALATAYTAA